MAIGYFGSYFSSAKSRFSPLAELVGGLAGNFNLGRLVYDEEKMRR